MKNWGSSKSIPLTSKNKVIVQANNYTFDKKSYQEEFLKPYLMKEDFEGIIEEANKLISKSWATKKEFEYVGLSKFTIIVIILSIAFTGGYMATLYISTHVDNEKSTVFFIISIAFMIAVLALTIILSLVTYCTDIEKYKSLDDIIKNYLDQYLGYINNYFEGYLFWTYDHVNYFIEINILNHDFQTQNQENEERKSERRSLIDEEESQFEESRIQSTVRDNIEESIDASIQEKINSIKMDVNQNNNNKNYRANSSGNMHMKNSKSMSINFIKNKFI